MASIRMFTAPPRLAAADHASKTAGGASLLLRLDPRLGDDLAPFCDPRADERRKFLGLPADHNRPEAAICSRTSGALKVRSSSRLSVWMVAPGVPAGTKNPFH